jgi:hypothetical protein
LIEVTHRKLLDKDYLIRHYDELWYILENAKQNLSVGSIFFDQINECILEISKRIQDKINYYMSSVLHSQLK